MAEVTRVLIKTNSLKSNMKTRKSTLLWSSLLAATLALTGCSTSTPTTAQYKYSTAIAPGVAVPDKIESSLGTLNLHYGYPSAGTVEKIYDNLDRSRALQAYLMLIFDSVKT